MPDLLCTPSQTTTRAPGYGWISLRLDFWHMVGISPTGHLWRFPRLAFDARSRFLELVFNSRNQFPELGFNSRNRFPEFVFNSRNRFPNCVMKRFPFESRFPEMNIEFPESFPGIEHSIPRITSRNPQHPLHCQKWQTASSNYTFGKTAQNPAVAKSSRSWLADIREVYQNF